jgi:hypothetical protein
MPHRLIAALPSLLLTFTHGDAIVAQADITHRNKAIVQASFDA